MGKLRQDSWTQEEDTRLANIVLQYIENGKTQLDAFNDASEKLSRTAAACGFRWNATLRKRYGTEIKQARNRKKTRANRMDKVCELERTEHVDEQMIHTFFTLLQNMQQGVNIHRKNSSELTPLEISGLVEENQLLKRQMQRYEEAWEEMRTLWEWIKKENEQ